MSCEVSQVGFPVNAKKENRNPMIIYVCFLFSLFLVLEINYFFHIPISIISWPYAKTYCDMVAVQLTPKQIHMFNL